MSVRQTFIGSELLITPGMQVMETAIADLGDELTVVNTPLHIYLDRLPNMAETESGPVSYYSLAPVEPTYDVNTINQLSAGLMQQLGVNLEAAVPKPDDPLTYLDEMRMGTDPEEHAIAARVGLSERIGRVSIRKSVYLNHDIAGGNEPEYNRTDDIRHKLVADIFPDIDSARSGGFKQRRIFLTSGRAERRLRRSAKD